MECGEVGLLTMIRAKCLSEGICIHLHQLNMCFLVFDCLLFFFVFSASAKSMSFVWYFVESRAAYFSNHAVLGQYEKTRTL